MTYNLFLQNDNTIKIVFPFDPLSVNSVKKFSVREFNSEWKFWTIPLKIASEIPSVLGIEIPKDILNKYHEVYVPHYVKYNPIFLKNNISAYQFQIEGIEFLTSNKNALLADEVGLGKTFQCILASLHLKCNKVLVVCPASVKRQWCREIQKFTNESCIVIDGSKKQRETQYSNDVKFYITNYELLMSDINIINMHIWDMVIADEASRIKNWKSKTKKLLLRIVTKYKIGISATPIENNINELYSIISWINPDILGNYYDFINKYCYFCNSPYGGYNITGLKDYNGLKNILKNVMIRRKKEDVFNDLPEIVYNEYYIPLTSVQRRMYNEIKKNIISLVQKDVANNNILSQIMYLREVCNSPRLLNKDIYENGKVQEIIEIIKQFSTEHKIVIFSQWSKFLYLIEEELKKEEILYVSIRGDIIQEDRDINLNKFNEDQNTRILLSTDAGNMGLNLQVADVLIHCDLLWNPQKMKQREGRLHRIGQKNKVNVITIMTQNTVEDRVYSILKYKSDIFDQIIGDEINLNKDLIRRLFKEK